MPIIASSPSRLINRRFLHSRNTPTAPRPWIIDRSSSSPSDRRTLASSSSSSSAVTSTALSQETSSSKPSLTSEQVHIHRRAKSAQSHGRPWDALNLLHEHLPSYPQDTHLISLAASIEAKLGVKSGLGSKMLERALQANPGHAALIHASAMLQYNRKDADLLCSEVSHAALSAVELHERGRQESDRGNHSEARTLFSHALKKDPTMPHTYVRWARMESKLDVQKAIEIYLEGYTSCHPSQLFRSEPPINSNGINAAVEDKGGLNTNSSLSHFQRQAKRFIPLLHSWASLEESQGRLTKARALLKEALQLDPGHVPSWMSLGRVIWSLGGAEEGRKVWGLGCEVVGPSAPLLHQWSQKELRAGGNIQTHKTIEEQRGEAKSSDALPNLANSSAAEGSNATFQSIKAESSSASTADAIKMNNGNKDEKPLDLFSPDALNRWPSNLIKPWKSLSWSTAPTAAAARSRARALLALALEIDRKHGPSIQASAALEDRSGLVQKSDAIYKDHLSNSLDGTFPQLLHSRAIQLLKRGEREQALNLLSQLSSAHPHNAHLCHTLGILAQQEGQWESARDHFLRGTKMAPPTSSASSHLPSASSNSLPGLLLCYEGLAELLAFKGDISAAKSVYESGFKSFRTLKLTPRFLRQYASFEKRSGSLQAASDLYRLAAQIEPCDPKTWLQWGVVERRRKRYEMAEECFRRGVAAAPTHPHLWYAYGTMQWKLGNIEGARATFSQATGLCPRSPPLWMEWAIMEWTSSQGKGAGEARRLFQHGSDPSKITTPYQHPPLFQAWADMERADGNEDKANKLLEQATLFSIRKSSKEERPR